MTEVEFVKEIRKMAGPREQQMSNEELLSYVSFHHRSHMELAKKAASNNPDEQDRGIETIFAGLGTPEAVLAAFLIQLLAKYSKDMVGEIVQFYKNLSMENQNEQEEVSGKN